MKQRPKPDTVKILRQTFVRVLIIALVISTVVFIVVWRNTPVFNFQNVELGTYESKSRYYFISVEDFQSTICSPRDVSADSRIKVCQLGQFDYNTWYLIYEYLPLTGNSTTVKQSYRLQKTDLGWTVSGIQK